MGNSASGKLPEGFRTSWSAGAATAPQANPQSFRHRAYPSRFEPPCAARVPVKDVGHRFLRVWSLALTFRELALIKVRSSTDGVRRPEHRMKVSLSRVPRWAVQAVVSVFVLAVTAPGVVGQAVPRVLQGS